MQEHPIVSIAIITYNQKEYLRECIESILEQDYPNIEIVVADDASTDGTQEMLQEYDKKYPNKFILKLSEKNQGITKNSNLAHFACNGKYIAWMGGDDLMLPGKIRKQVEYMENTPKCSICYHDLDVFDSDSDKTLFYFNNEQKLEGDVRVVIKYGTFNGACSTMVRNSNTPKSGFDVRIPVASDWLYWVETLVNGGTINFINEVLGRYRRHHNNVTKKDSKIFMQNELDHLNSCNILLGKYPQYQNEILYRYSENIRALRLIKVNYIDYTIASAKINFNLKAIISLIIYYLTFGKVKK